MHRDEAMQAAEGLETQRLENISKFKSLSGNAGFLAQELSEVGRGTRFAGI